MIYKMLPKDEPTSQQIYGRIDDDGVMRVTCTANHPPFQEWLAEGNTPQPTD